MTLPAAFFMWVRGKELVGRNRQAMAYITLVATATAFGGDSSKGMFRTLMQQLENADSEDWVHTASDAELTVLYGSRYKGRGGEKK
jgi:hypothetical protein